MFTLWRTVFIDAESGLPWAVIAMMPWLKMVEKEKTAATPSIQENADAPEKSLKKTLKAEPAKTRKAATKTKPATVLDIADQAVKTPTQTLSPDTRKTTGKTIPTRTAPLTKKAVTTPTKNTSAKTQEVTENTTPIKTFPASEKTAGKPSAAKVKTVATAEEPPLQTITALHSVAKKNPMTAMLPKKAQNLVSQISTSSPKAQIREAITLLCKTQEWISSATLASTLKHKPDQLETLHLIPMVKSGELLLRYPENIQHPQQSYGLAKK